VLAVAVRNQPPSRSPRPISGAHVILLTPNELELSKKGGLRAEHGGNFPPAI
jgi:hypothetical protein